MTSPWQGEESGEYFWSYMQDGDIFGWHLSLGVALEVTLLSDIPDMIFLGKQPYVSVFARFLPFLRDFIDFDPSTPLIQLNTSLEFYHQKDLTEFARFRAILSVFIDFDPFAPLQLKH